MSVLLAAGMFWNWRRESALIQNGAAMSRLLTTQTHVEIVPEPLQVATTEGWVDAGGAKLWYWDTGGNGEPVVFVHPRSGSGLSWTYQQPVFARAGYRVIGYSCRGHARSEQSEPPQLNPSGVEDLRKLAEHLRLGRFHLIGSAAGGMLAARYSVAYPQTLRSLVLASSILGIQDSAYEEKRAPLLPRTFHTLPREFRELGPSYRAANPQGVARWLEIEKSSRAEPPAPTLATPGTTDGPAASLITRDPSENQKPLTFETLSAVAAKIPVLLLTADADLFMPPSLLSYVAARIPHASLAIIENAGHAAFWEQPVAFNRTLLEFLKGQRSSG